MDRELSRFFEISALRRIRLKMTPMFSWALDSYWKMKLQAKSFCADDLALDVMRHDVPGKGMIEWIEDYEVTHCALLHPLWFMTTDGVFNEALYETYRRAGVIETEWISQGF